MQSYQDVPTVPSDVNPISVALDNQSAPPDRLEPVVLHTTPYPFYRPGTWLTDPRAAAARKWGSFRLPIRIVPLPTSAVSDTPIEKMWRRLRQEVTRLHRRTNDLPWLHEEVDHVLTVFAGGSADLLHAVGLNTGFNSLKIIMSAWVW